jgi:hypothetical protein
MFITSKAANCVPQHANLSLAAWPPSVERLCLSVEGPSVSRLRLGRRRSLRTNSERSGKAEPFRTASGKATLQRFQLASLNC